MPDKRGAIVCLYEKAPLALSNPLRKTLKWVHLCMEMKSQRRQGIGEALMLPRGRGLPGQSLNTNTPPGK